MAFLHLLSPDQRETIISLPYRVGIWVARSDAGKGGAEEERQEMAALSSIIHAFAEEMFGSEVMQEIISATVANKARWGLWAKKVRSVPNDCRVSVDVIDEYDPKQAAVFRLHLMEIAEAVAMAFQENDSMGFFQRLNAWLNYATSGRKGRKKSFEEYLRISANERRALTILAQSLGGAY